MDREAEGSQLTVDFLFVDLWVVFFLVAEVIKKKKKERISTLDH